MPWGKKSQDTRYHAFAVDYIKKTVVSTRVVVTEMESGEILDRFGKGN